MFLIKGNKGSVLYTGDCRLERDTISRLNSDDILSIKALYIDTTKFQEQFLHIPTKQRSIDALINFIESQDKNDDTTQYILTKPWDFGSEDILIGLSKHFNTKIKVSQKRFNVYNFLEDLKDHFTVGNSRFHFGKYHKIHHQKFRVIHWIPYSFWNSEWEDSEDPSYCVDFLDKVIPENIPENSNGDCIVLNYSMHSSAQEIMDTVNLFDKDCQVHFCVVDQKEKTCEKMSWLLEKMDLRRSIKSLKRSYSNASTVLIERSHSIESLDLLRDFD